MAGMLSGNCKFWAAEAAIETEYQKRKKRRIVGFIESIIWRFYRIGRCVDGQVSCIDNRILSYTVVCVHKVLSTNSFKVTEIRNDRHLLAGEGQIDEVFELVVTVLRGHCLKLLELMI